MSRDNPGKNIHGHKTLKVQDSVRRLNEQDKPSGADREAADEAR